MVLGIYKRQIKRDVMVTVALKYNLVLCLHGKETETSTETVDLLCTDTFGRAFLSIPS